LTDNPTGSDMKKKIEKTYPTNDVPRRTARGEGATGHEERTRGTVKMCRGEDALGYQPEDKDLSVLSGEGEKCRRNKRAPKKFNEKVKGARLMTLGRETQVQKLGKTCREGPRKVGQKNLFVEKDEKKEKELRTIDGVTVPGLNENTNTLPGEGGKRVKAELGAVYRKVCFLK